MLWPSAAPEGGSGALDEGHGAEMAGGEGAGVQRLQHDQRRQRRGEGHAGPAHHAAGEAQADQAGDADALHQPAAAHHHQDLDGDALAPQQADGDVVEAGGAPGQRAEAVEHGVARLAEARGDHEQHERPVSGSRSKQAERRVTRRARARGSRSRQQQRERHQQHHAARRRYRAPTAGRNGRPPRRRSACRR